MNKIFLLVIAIFSCTLTNAQWEQTNGPFAGKITCVDTLGPRIYVGTSKGEVFMSADSGASWTVNPPLSLPTFVQNIYSIEATPTKVFIGTNNGMFYSTDYGNTWPAVGSGSILGGHIYALTVSGTRIFAGTILGVCESTDNGVTWTEKIIPGTPATCYATVLVFCDTTLFVSTLLGDFRSTNYGNTWTATTGIGGSDMSSVTSSGSNIYLSTLSDVFRSTDNGSTWTSITPGVAPWVLWLAATGPYVYVATDGDGVFRSSDYGATWTPMNLGIETDRIFTILVKGGNTVYAGGDNGFYISNDTAATWINSSKGIGTTDVYALTASPAGVFAGLNIGGVHRTSDDGNSWQVKSTGLSSGATTSMDVMAAMDTTLFAISNGFSVLMRSSDGGDSWSNITAGLSSAGSINGVTAEGTNLYACCDNGLFLSTNRGNTWTLVNASLQFKRLLFNGPVMIVLAYSGIHRSLDNGVTFTSISAGTSFNYIYDIAVGGGAVYVGGDALFSSGNIFRTLDNGDNWTNLDNTNGLPLSTAVFSHALAAHDSFVYAWFQDSWIYASADQGNNWYKTDSCFSLMGCMKIVPPYIYGGTLDGVWRGLANTGVWPGDADNDNVVSPADLLQVGLFYGSTGMARASVSNSWQEFPSLNWNTSQSNGSDIHHVDCNGDGVVNSNDTLAINLNMSLVHTFQPTNNMGPRIASNLFFVTDQSAYNGGDWVDVEVWAGDSLNPVSNLYGLAFDISYDASLVQPGTESITYPSSWLGTIGTNAIKVSGISAPGNSAKGAITRINHMNASGYGKIANFKFQLKSSISPTTTTIFDISGYTANNEAGEPVAFSSSSHSIVVNSVVGISEGNQNEFLFNVFPNPYSESTQVIYVLTKKSSVIIEIYNGIGQKMGTLLNAEQSAGEYKYSFSASDYGYGAGVYFVKFIVDGKVTMKKLVEIK